MSPTGTTLSIDVTRTALLTGIATQVATSDAALHAAGDWLRARQARVFATGGAGSWPGDDPVTLLHKNGSRTLVDNGGLLDSLTNANAPGAEHAYGSDSVTVATSLVQGIMAQRGAHGAPKRNPAPTLTRNEVADVTQTILDALLTVRR